MRPHPVGEKTLPMRSEAEMLCLVTETAADERIRGAYLSGSRAREGAPEDLFRDFDVAYLVTETGSFRGDRTWIDRFGERLYMQYPEEGPEPSSRPEKCYGWLMQFADGNRLDLHVFTLDFLPEMLEWDLFYRVLLDKDGHLPKEDRTSESAVFLRRPTQEEFRFVCNEFWWCLNNVGKGLWRGELLYVLDMLNFYVRPMLVRMLEFRAGLANGFGINTGKCSKYLPRFLPPETWRRQRSAIPTTYGRPKTAAPSLSTRPGFPGTQRAFFKTQTERRRDRFGSASSHLSLSLPPLIKLAVAVGAASAVVPDTAAAGFCAAVGALAHLVVLHFGVAITTSHTTRFPLLLSKNFGIWRCHSYFLPSRTKYEWKYLPHCR